MSYQTSINPDNTGVEWRDEFSTLPVVGTNWQRVSQTGTAAVRLEGNAAGARYLCITLDPRDPTASYDLIASSTRAMLAPFRVGFAITLSRRSLYSLCSFGMVGLDASGGLSMIDAAASTISLTGGIVVNTNVATATATAAHGLIVGQRVSIYGNADPRVNGYYLIATTPTPTTFTYALTIGNATYGSTATALPIEAAMGAQDSMTVLTRDLTSGNADMVVRCEGLSAYANQWNPGNTWDLSAVPNTGVNYTAPYTYAHQPNRVMEFVNEKDWCGVLMSPVDSTSSMTAVMTRDQNIPFSASGGYVPRLKVQNLPNTSVPVGSIKTISKSGSTTATITMTGHGLTTTDFITIYGVRDQTNFANQNTSIVVASVIDANTFTVAFGASATATSYGGTVFRAQGGSQPTAIATSSIQSIGVANGRLIATFLASQGTFTVGESICLTGLVDSTNTLQSSYEGLYRVASSSVVSFTTELEPLQSQTVPTGTLTVSGTFFAAPDVRLHFLRAQAHGRVGVEIESSRASTRQQSSVPVSWSGSNPINVAQIGGSTASTSLDTLGANRALGVFDVAPISTTERASAALTTSGNSGTISDALGQTYCGLINVTAVSGTTPTLDIILQESYDAGTTYQDLYQVQRITATGTYLIPPMILVGRRRYNYVVAGTTPSFTFAITTMRGSLASGYVRQTFDRTIVPNTLNSTTPSFYVEGCKTFGLFVVSAAGASVAPVYTVEFSSDNSNWWTSTSTVTGTASSVQAAAATCPFSAKWMRARITTAGTGAVQTYVEMTALS